MLEFDAKTHTYTLDGRQIPSVSEIIRFMHNEIYKGTDKAVMDIAADKGTRVHAACQELDESGTTECDPDIEFYVRAYIQFCKDHRCKWKGIEKIVYGDTEYGEFAGTLDRYGLIDGESTILDIKTTSQITKKHELLYAIQMTGYWMGLMSEPCDLPRKFAILQLKKDGTYKLIYVDKKQEEFNACLRMHYSVAETYKRKKRGK